MTPTDYDDLINSKLRKTTACGFEPMEIHAPLFEWQKIVVRWAIKQGRAALFEECGLGKTAQQIEWARQVAAYTQNPVLILCPLAVAEQTVNEGKKFGIPITHARDASEIVNGVNITNYERLHLFDDVGFSGVVLDECFAPGTMVECFQNGVVHSKDIRYIRPHEKIINAAGVDTVKECHRRKITRAFAVTFKGNRIIASENHPWFTSRGWVPTRALRETDTLLETAEAMRMVRRVVHSEVGSISEGEILREVLLSEMEDATTRSFSEGSYEGCSPEDWSQSFDVVNDYLQGEGSRPEICGSQADEGRSDSPQSEPEIATDEPQTIRAWWKRKGDDQAAIAALGGVIEWVGSRVLLVSGNKGSRFSDMLQNGFGESGYENSNRGGRGEPSLPQGSGSEKGYEAGFVRLDGIEILEQGHPELEQFRDADGNVYFYDIGLTRHPSFSINGTLVHNSSILKSFNGKTRQLLTQRFASVNYRLCCTATPSPNDFTELGQHADFLGICSPAVMLATYFINDTFDTGTWRLKGHSEETFWRWVSSWAACISTPSDLGFDDTGYVLPPLTTEVVTVAVDHRASVGEELFHMPNTSATNLHKEMRRTMKERVEAAAKIVNATTEQFIVWTESNEESAEIAKSIPDSVEVVGADSMEFKGAVLKCFSGTADDVDWALVKKHSKKSNLDSSLRVLVSKPSIFGFGCNMQFCRNDIYVGMTHSFEKFYQAGKRIHRFGQKMPVKRYIVQADTENGVMTAIMRKQSQHDTMRELMKFTRESLAGQSTITHMKTDITSKIGDNWTLYHGDCVRVARTLKEDSIGFSVFSPPFADLFTYSSDIQDMGNCADMEAFMKQFEFLVDELLRITMPGRECAVHCCDLLATKWKDGDIEFKDFSGTIARCFRERGWLLHSRVCIWKDPVTEMQRTKAHGLLYKTLRTDSSKSRVGSADYLLVFRKPGINTKPITHDVDSLPLDRWQELASPVWMTVDQGRVLNGRMATEDKDERHICPLQLDVIERALTLWSAPDDLVFSPFTGIGSEGYCALQMGRRFVGAELKESYFNAACSNLGSATQQQVLFTTI